MLQTHTSDLFLFHRAGIPQRYSKRQTSLRGAKESTTNLNVCLIVIYGCQIPYSKNYFFLRLTNKTKTDLILLFTYLSYLLLQKQTKINSSSLS